MLPTMVETKWTEKQGRKVIKQWRRSGLSMSAFARESGWNTQRLRYWRDRLQEDDASSERGTGSTERAQKLVPGLVVDVGAKVGLSIVLPQGIVLEARSCTEVDPKWLADVVRALDGGR